VGIEKKSSRRPKAPARILDTAEIMSIGTTGYDYDEFEGMITSHVLVKLEIGPLNKSGTLEWHELDRLVPGLLRAIELRVLQRLRIRERDVEIEEYGDYNPNWEEYGNIFWSREEAVSVKRGQKSEVEIEVQFSDHVG